MTLDIIVIIFAINYRHWIIDAYTHFGLPYMLYDIIAMCEAFRQEDQKLLTSPYSKVALEFLKANWLMVLHHLGLAFICLPILLVSVHCMGNEPWTIQ